jgi:hypothetical protein
MKVYDWLTRETLAQLLDRCGLLLFANLLVLLLVGCSPKALPWQTAPQEVHKDVAQGLQIISPGLLCGVRISSKGVKVSRNKRQWSGESVREG